MDSSNLLSLKISKSLSFLIYLFFNKKNCEMSHEIGKKPILHNFKRPFQFCPLPQSTSSTQIDYFICFNTIDICSFHREEPGLDCPITMDTLSRVRCFTTSTSSSNIPFPRISPTPRSTLPTVSVLRTSPRPG